MEQFKCINQKSLMSFEVIPPEAIEYPRFSIFDIVSKTSWSSLCCLTDLSSCEQNERNMLEVSWNSPFTFHSCNWHKIDFVLFVASAQDNILVTPSRLIVFLDPSNSSNNPINSSQSSFHIGNNLNLLTAFKKSASSKFVVFISACIAISSSSCCISSSSRTSSGVIRVFLSLVVDFLKNCLHQGTSVIRLKS